MAVSVSLLRIISGADNRHAPKHLLTKFDDNFQGIFFFWHLPWFEDLKFVFLNSWVFFFVFFSISVASRQMLGFHNAQGSHRDREGE